MATSNKERQKKWRQKQKDKDKKSITIFLSQSAREKLYKHSQNLEKSYSTFITDLIMNKNNSAPVNELTSKLTKHLDYVQDLVLDLKKSLKKDSSDLEKEITARIKAERSLKKSEDEFRFLVENSHDIIYLTNLEKKCLDFVSPSSKMILGWEPEEVVGLSFKDASYFVHPDDIDRFREHFSLAVMGKKPAPNVSVEYRLKHKTRGYLWVNNTYTLIIAEDGKFKSVIGNIRDIQKRKMVEMELLKYQNELESKVAERTASLEEANNALRLMLKKENELKSEIENKILFNIKEQVFPYVERLKSALLNNKEKEYLDILESSLNNILAPFIRDLSSKILNLSPGEMQVASLIQQGKTTKEIAWLINLSTRTIEFHRANIRKKAGISRKTSLRSYIQSIGR